MTHCLFPKIVRINCLCALTKYSVCLNRITLTSNFLVLVTLTGVFKIGGTTQMRAFVTLLLTNDIVILNVVTFKGAPSLAVARPVFSSGGNV